MLLFSLLSEPALAYHTYCLEAWNFHPRYVNDGGDIGWNGPSQGNDNSYEGFNIQGGGGLYGEQTWNMIGGGYIQFSMDTTVAQSAVNNNFYLVSPNYDQFHSRHYCDAQGYGYDSDDNCLELDIQENNGNCANVLGVHAWPDHNGGCDQGGCVGYSTVSGKRTYRMTFNDEGGFSLKYQNYGHTTWHSLHLTDHISGGDGREWADAKARIKHVMTNHGFQIQSSQWEGWVPSASDCGSGSGINNSNFWIWNVVVHGDIVWNIDSNTPPRCDSGRQAILDDEGAMQTLVHSHTLLAGGPVAPTTDAPADETTVVTAPVGTPPTTSQPTTVTAPVATPVGGDDEKPGKAPKPGKGPKGEGKPGKGPKHPKGEGKHGKGKGPKDVRKPGKKGKHGKGKPGKGKPEPADEPVTLATPIPPAEPADELVPENL